MDIPLLNFLITLTKKDNFPIINKYKIDKDFSLSFDSKSLRNYPIYNLFKSLNKNNPVNLINFNILNESAVNLYINGKIKFHQIPGFIKKNLVYKEKINLNSINKILDYNNKIIYKLNKKYFLDD